MPASHIIKCNIPETGFVFLIYSTSSYKLLRSMFEHASLSFFSINTNFIKVRQFDSLINVILETSTCFPLESVTVFLT